MSVPRRTIQADIENGEAAVRTAISRRLSILPSIDGSDDAQRAGLLGAGADGFVVRVRVGEAQRALKITTPRTLAHMRLVQEQEMHAYLFAHTDPNSPVIPLFDFWETEGPTMRELLSDLGAANAVVSSVAGKTTFVDSRAAIFGTEMELAMPAFYQLFYVEHYLATEFTPHIAVLVAHMLGGLAVLRATHFTHNDLHPGNTRLIRLASTVEGFSYFSNGTWWNVSAAVIIDPQVSTSRREHRCTMVMTDFGRSALTYMDAQSRRTYGTSANSFMWLWNAPEFPNAQIRQFLASSEANPGYDMWLFGLFVLRAFAQLRRYSPVLHRIVLALLPPHDRVHRFFSQVDATAGNAVSNLLYPMLRVTDTINSTQMHDVGVRTQLNSMLVGDDSSHRYLLRLPWHQNVYATPEEALEKLAAFTRDSSQRNVNNTISRTDTPRFTNVVQWR